jgi:hypothetical protein
VTVVLSVLVLIGLVCFLLWLIGLPGDDGEEEAAGFMTANWDRIRDRFGG